MLLPDIPYGQVARGVSMHCTYVRQGIAARLTCQSLSLLLVPVGFRDDGAIKRCFLVVVGSAPVTLGDIHEASTLASITTPDLLLSSLLDGRRSRAAVGLGGGSTAPSACTFGGLNSTRLPISLWPCGQRRQCLPPRLARPSFIQSRGCI